MTICWNYYGYIAAKLQIPTFFEFSPWFCTFCTAPFNLPGLEKKSQWPPLAALFGFFSSHQFGVSQPRGEPSVRIFWLKAVKKWVQPKQPGGGLDPLGSPETEKGLLRDQLRGIPVPIKRPLVHPKRPNALGKLIRSMPKLGGSKILGWRTDDGFGGWRCHRGYPVAATCGGCCVFWKLKHWMWLFRSIL